MSTDELGLEAQVASMAEQCRRVFVDWENAVSDRDVALVNLTRAVNLLGQLADPDPCSFDHHGDCQAHGYFNLMGCLCPQQAAKNLLTELT